MLSHLSISPVEHTYVTSLFVYRVRPAYITLRVKLDVLPLVSVVSQVRGLLLAVLRGASLNIAAANGPSFGLGVVLVLPSGFLTSESQRLNW